MKELKNSQLLNFTKNTLILQDDEGNLYYYDATRLLSEVRYRARQAAEEAVRELGES